MFRLGRIVVATSRYVITSIIILKRQCLSLTSSLSSSSSLLLSLSYNIFSIEEQMLGIWAVMVMVMEVITLLLLSLLLLSLLSLLKGITKPAEPYAIPHHDAYPSQAYFLGIEVIYIHFQLNH
jgi:hypothetical protein